MAVKVAQKSQKSFFESNRAILRSTLVRKECDEN